MFPIYIYMYTVKLPKWPTDIKTNSKDHPIDHSHTACIPSD